MKVLAMLLVVGGLMVTSASANLIVNGDFSSGLDSWLPGGEVSIRNPWDFGFPPSPPTGGQFAAVLSSWGGNWSAPLGSIAQDIILTGPMVLSGDIYAAAHAGDPWRNVITEVLWNGQPVASLGRDADAVGYADAYPWQHFEVPVTGVGFNTLQVNFIVHFAEWSWTGVDNLSLDVPEPASLLLLGLGLPMLRRRGRR